MNQSTLTLPVALAWLSACAVETDPAEGPSSSVDDSSGSGGAALGQPGTGSDGGELDDFPTTSGGANAATGGAPATSGSGGETADGGGTGESTGGTGSGGSPVITPNGQPRVIVSTDIGGCDDDDFQSMVHYLIYADRFNTEGLISSPPCGGRDDDIFETLDAYEVDYPLLAEHGDFPTAEDLRSLTFQGATDSGGPDDGKDTDGSNHIIERAKNGGESPLYVLVWGSITDVAQAVYDDPTITDTIRVYSIGSWNTGKDRASRDYLYENHRDSIWWIENDTTFRGMYVDCGHDEDPGNGFLGEHVNGHGALGAFLYDKKSGLKMGDTPSVLYMLHGDPSDPTGESWGGSFFLEDDSYPTFWTDRSDEACGDKDGANTVGKWRKDYLDDWRQRMDWVKQ